MRWLKSDISLALVNNLTSHLLLLTRASEMSDFDRASEMSDFNQTGIIYTL